MHVGAECGSRCVIGKAPGLRAGFREVQSASTEFTRHRHGEVAGLAKVLKILEKEAIVAVVARRAVSHPIQQIAGQDCTSCA